MFNIFKRITATTFFLIILISPSMASDTWARWLKFEKSFLKDEMAIKCNFFNFKITKLMGIKRFYILDAGGGDWIRKRANFQDSSVSYSDKEKFNLGQLQAFNRYKTIPSDITKTFFQYLPKEIIENIESDTFPNLKFLELFSDYFVITSPLSVEYKYTVFLNNNFLSLYVYPINTQLKFKLKQTAKGYAKDSNNSRITRAFDTYEHTEECELIKY